MVHGSEQVSDHWLAYVAPVPLALKNVSVSIVMQNPVNSAVSAGWRLLHLEAQLLKYAPDQSLEHVGIKRLKKGQRSRVFHELPLQL